MQVFVKAKHILKMDSMKCGLEHIPDHFFHHIGAIV